MKPSWKGTLTLGLVSVPVHLFATADKKSQAPVGHGVHRKCQAQAEAKKHCPECKEEIPENELMKGYDVPADIYQVKLGEAQAESLKSGKPLVTPAQYVLMDEELRDGVICGPSKFVELTEAEIASVKVDSSKVISITLIADEKALDPLMILETNYLMNDGTAVAAEAEAVLVQAMRGKIGVGTLTRGGRQKQVAIRVYGDGFVIHSLRTADQMKAMPDRPALPKASTQMVALAKQLVESMEGELDLSEHEDEYANGLRAMVAAKAGGDVIEAAPEQPKKKVASLMDALAASLKAKTETATQKPAASKPKRKAS